MKELLPGPTSRLDKNTQKAIEYIRCQKKAEFP
jgi:hypothetical protein